METTIEASGSEVTRTTVDDLMPEQSGILSTARHKITGGPAGTLRDDSLVTYEGMQITLRDAAKLGLVVRDESGKYSDVRQSNEQQPAATDKDAAESEGISFEPQQEAMTAHLASVVLPTVQESAVHEIIDGGLEGLKSGGEHSDGIREVAKSFQAQGFAHFTKAGVDPIEFSQWARTNAPGEIKAAMLTHVGTRNPSAYNALIQRFINGTAPTIAAMKAGGFETKTDRNGVEMVNIPTIGWVTAKAAAKAQLI